MSPESRLPPFLWALQTSNQNLTTRFFQLDESKSLHGKTRYISTKENHVFRVSPNIPEKKTRGVCSSRCACVCLLLESPRFFSTPTLRFTTIIHIHPRNYIEYGVGCAKLGRAPLQDKRSIIHTYIYISLYHHISMPDFS